MFVSFVSAEVTLGAIDSFVGLIKRNTQDPFHSTLMHLSLALELHCWLT